MSDQPSYPSDPQQPGSPPPSWQSGPQGPPAWQPGPSGPPPWQSGPMGPPPSAGYQQGPAKTDGMAIGGFVCAIIGLLFFGIILGPTGVVLGILAKRRIDRWPERYKGSGLAIAAIVIGAIATVLAIILILAIANDNSIVG